MAKSPRLVRDILNAPLRLPRFYQLLQDLVGASRDRAVFVRSRVACRPGEKIVDIGCGTGSALEFLPETNYFGFDPNPDYVRVAQTRYGNRAKFLCGDASSPQVWELARQADTVLSLGVLHHLTDTEIQKILNLARICLRPRGQFVFYEPCFSGSDRWLGRIFMRLDRGGNIKTDKAWRALVSEYFATINEDIRRPAYLFRYTIQTLICRDPRQS